MSDLLQKGKKPIKQEQKNSLIPEKFQDILYILLLVASIFIFFWGAVSGGGFNSSDNVASNSFITFLNDAKQSGEFPHWINYIFGGMPCYASLLTTGVRWWDFATQLFLGSTRVVGGIFDSDVARVLTFYAFYAIGMYLLMRSKKHERFVSFMTGFAAVFSTYVVTWVMIGHNTKPIVLALFPYVFLLLEKLRVRFSLLYSVLLVFAVHLMFEGNHIQMIFYAAIAISTYFLFELISGLASKQEVMRVLRSAGIMIAAAGIAFLMSSDRYLATFEYTPYSTRGTAPIKQVTSQHIDKPSRDYNYSTMWSFNPGETFTFLVPGFFGNKPIEFQGQEQEIYFGSKESEDSPPYMGIGVLGLAIIGLILYRKDSFVQALSGISLISLIMSFGKNAPGSDTWYIVLAMFAAMGAMGYYFSKGKVPKPIFGGFAAIFLVYLTGLIGIHSFDMFKLYDAMFWNLPMFYTFRAPSMALALLHFAVPVLAGYGLSGIIKMRSEMTKNEKILILSTVGISVGFLIAGFIYSSGFQTTYLGYINEKLAGALQGQALPTEIADGLWNGMMSDWYFSAFVLIVFAVTTYMFVQKKLPKGIYFTILLVAFAADMFRVDVRPMKPSENKLADEIFAPYEGFYSQLTADKDLFRIVDFAAPHNNLPAYFRLQSVGGYHPAKLRVYQDLMDIANVGGHAGSTHQLVNPFLWNLMNVKYIIDVDKRSQNPQPKIYPNPTVLPRAFFVNNCVVAKPIDILTNLRDGNFNPKDTVFVETALNTQIQPTDSTVSAKVVEYKNESLKIQAKASGNNFLFISEIYYKPSWKAYIDGKETPIIKSNYAFRGVVVPAGEHTIEMKFHSDKFEAGKTYSLVANIVCIILGGVGIFFEVKRRKSSGEQQ